MSGPTIGRHHGLTDREWGEQCEAWRQAGGRVVLHGGGESHCTGAPGFTWSIRRGIAYRLALPDAPDPAPIPDGLPSDAVPTGVDLIAAERRRQVEAEGWTPEHDARHTNCEMGRAARCYAAAASEGWDSRTLPPADWPWERHWWKPSDDPVRNLVKAGALIAAEIDRLAVPPPPATEDVPLAELIGRTLPGGDSMVTELRGVKGGWQWRDETGWCGIPLPVNPDGTVTVLAEDGAR